jgi:hypothetical protein
MDFDMFEYSIDVYTSVSLNYIIITFRNVSQGEKNVHPERDMNPRPSEYRTVAPSTELSGLHSLHTISPKYWTVLNRGMCFVVPNYWY